MFDGSNCTIYPQRPQTCRDYDCRVFAAAGLEAGSADKQEINRRVGLWRFSYADARAEAQHRAVQSAARFIRDRQASFAHERVPTATTGIAVLALKVYELFLEPRDGADAGLLAADVTARWEAFDREVTWFGPTALR
jgi:hypothetical protein